MILKYKINLDRSELKQLCNKHSANFAAIKSYYGLDLDSGKPALQLFFLTYVTPYFNQQKVFGSEVLLYGDVFGGKSEHRERVFVGDERYLFSVNDYNFPKESNFSDVIHRAVHRPDYGGYFWFNTLLHPGFFPPHTVEDDIMEKFFLMLYYFRARDVELGRCELKKFLQCYKGVKEKSAKLWEEIHQSAHEGKVNFVSGIRQSHVFEFYDINDHTELRTFYETLQKFEFEPVEFNISLEDYKQFLLYMYHQKSGKFPVANFDDFSLVLSDTIDELIQLDLEITYALLYNAKDDYRYFFEYYWPQSSYFKTYWPRRFKHALKNLPSYYAAR